MKRKTLIMTVSFVMGAVMLMSSIPMQFLFAGAASDTGTYAIRTRTAVPPVLTGPLNAATDVVLKTDPDTMINPVGISYQYQPEYQSRESADPAVALYKGVYYLFASHGSGYWWSDNLADWNYVYAMDSANLIPPHRSNNDFERFAPATMVIGDYLYITHSEGGSIFRSNNPKNPGSWEFIRAAVNGWGDPALFYDDELDRTFCYYGTSGSEPLYVVEMDHKTAGWPVLAGPIALYNSNREAHGYEVCGEDNEKFADNPFLEGAWMTKFGGKYYLEFGVPGTQWGSYADGVAVSDDPLGPFVHCDSSPVSIKPTGFVRGAGHGCTFEDKYGSWWKVDTVSLSTNTGFERRLILFPAGHNAYGDLVSNTVFSDYPMYKHEMTEFSLENPGPAWNLVSYNPAAVTASSTLPPGPPNAHQNTTLNYAPANAFNENMKNWWSAATGNAGEWIQADLGKLTAVNAFQINFADQGATTRGVITAQNGRLNNFCYQYLVEFSIDGSTWHTLLDKTAAAARQKMAEDYSHPYYELAKTIGVRYIRVTNKGAIPLGGKFALSGIRLFGHGQGTAPAAVQNFTATRPVSDERSVNLTWDAVPGAEGYIIRYGYREDSRYNHYQVIGQNSATIRTLNRGVDYYFSIDAYNDSGVTKGTTVRFTPATLPVPEPTPFLRSVVNNLHSAAVLSNTQAPQEIGYDGVFFDSFEMGSYLISLGLKKYDIVTKLNGAPVTDTRGLLASYGAVPDGQEITLTIWRKNRYIDVKFTKGAMNGYLTVPCVIQAETYDAHQGASLKPEGCGDVGGGQNIGNIGSGDWVRYSNINFAAIPDRVVIRAAKDSGSNTVSVRLDSPTGPVIASAEIAATGGWQTYRDFPAPVTGEISEGLHDVYLTFSGSMNINWFSLNLPEEEDPYPAYEVARFSAFEQDYVKVGGGNGAIYADWKPLDGGKAVDLTTHDPEKLFLRLDFTLSASPTAVDLSNAFTSGQLKLRSPDQTGKPGDPDGAGNNEHNFGWDIRANWGLKIGENHIDIPLKDALGGVYTSDNSVPYGVNNRRGLMDWTAVGRIIFYIASIEQAQYAGITFTMSIHTARVVDITFEEECAVLQARIDDVIPQGDYTDKSYNAYLAALAFARLELEAADTIKEIHEAISTLQAAIDALTDEEEPDPVIYGDVNGDGDVTVADARMVLQHLVGKIILTAEQFNRAAVREAGKVEIADARLILQKLVGKITAFPRKA